MNISSPLKRNEIYLSLIVSKHNSDSNYYFFEKFLNGYDYNKVRYRDNNGNEILLHPSTDKEGWKEIFENLSVYNSSDYNLDIYKTDKSKFRLESIKFYLDLDERYGYGLKSDFSEIINQNELNNLIFDHKIINDPSLISVTCTPRIESIGGNATSIKIKEFRKNPDFVELKSDFLDWFYIAPPETHSDRQKKCPFSDEILLKAPYYRTEKLLSGAILLQMTEKTDFTKFDQEYWDKLMELYRYFAVHQNF